VISKDEIEAQASAFLHRSCVKTNEGDYAAFRPKVKDVNEVVKFLSFHCLLKEAPPRWIARDEEEGVERWLVFKNCLVNYETGEVRALTPKLWVHGGLDFDYDPEAQCPRWVRFLGEVHPNDLEAQDCVEELLGYGMTWDTSFDKAGLLVGPKRSGKSTVTWVLEQLVGTTLFTSLDFHDWTSNVNARANLLGKKVGLFPDVRLKPPKVYGNSGYEPGGLDHKSIQLLVQITGRDLIAIHEKYERQPWVGRLGIKFVVVSNETPNFHDEGGALLSRFVKIPFNQSLPEGEQDLGLREKLRAELPGIAARCLRAYHRLQRRGRFIQPKSADQLELRIKEKTNPYFKFMRDCFKIDPEGRVSTNMFWMKFGLWRENNKRADLQVQNCSQLAKIIKKIEPYDKILVTHRTGSGPRWYGGIEVKPEGAEGSEGGEEAGEG
jgi:putative DNA primase/helicase